MFSLERDWIQEQSFSKFAKSNYFDSKTINTMTVLESGWCINCNLEKQNISFIYEPLVSLWLVSLR